MAKKARFYQITTRDGHGESTFIIHAPKRSLIYKVCESDHVKVVNVVHLGFKTVETQLSEDLASVDFVVPELDNLVIQPYELGYRSLRQIFDNKVNDTFNDLKEMHGCDE